MKKPEETKQASRKLSLAKETVRTLTSNDPPGPLPTKDGATQGCPPPAEDGATQGCPPGGTTGSP
jgi:hypothetical protein